MLANGIRDSRCVAALVALTKPTISVARFVAITVLMLNHISPASAQQDQGPTPLTEHSAYREFGYVPMEDGVRLAYVLWRPKRDGRFPTVFHYSPYGSNAAPFSAARLFLEAGYAYLGVNIRGTGCSEGLDTEGGGARPTTVGRDGAEIVEWAAAQPWSTGNVGMIGNSYAGGLQLAVAVNRPPHLKAIVPSGIAASNYRESYMPGGMVHLGAMAAWSMVEQPNLSQSAEQVRIAAGDTECQAIRAKRQPIRAYLDMKEHPLQDGWWAEHELESMIGQIAVPTLVMMGWQDEWNLNAGTHLYKLLKTSHRRIILQNGGHGVGAPEVRGYQLDHKEEMRWLDRWLKGQQNGVDKEPPVVVFWEVQNAPIEDGSRATEGWKTTYTAWPVPNLQWSKFYLTADGRLSRTPPVASLNQGMRGYLYPAGTELVGSNEQFAIAPFDSGELSYRTEPMAEDMTLLGLPELIFYFSCEREDTDFMFTLKDIDPAGNTLFLQRAFLRASLRAIDEEKSTPDEIIQTFSKSDKLVPGQIYEVKISIPAIGHVVRRGHRLELSILAPSATPAPVMGGVPVGLPSLNKVYHSTRYPSMLILPVVPGEKAQKPAPTCGSLQFQPCRRARAMINQAPLSSVTDTQSQ
jgi:putative CocE/NonD family hydrolase